MKITKEMVNLDLECLEMAGRLAIEEKERGTEESSSDSEEEEDDEEEDKNERDEIKSVINEIKDLNLSNKNQPKPKIIELN